MQNAVEELADQFAAHFEVTDSLLAVRSPGRINLIGEHTDYNDGFVLPAAIDKAARIVLSLRSDNEIHLVARDLDEKYSVTLQAIRPLADHSWPNYILGAVAQLLKRGIQVPGFNALLTSDVPIGAGLSSSAAVACATLFALNERCQSGLDRLTLVKMAQDAEHEFAGVRCGVMDQFASLMGKKDALIKLDCRSLEYTYVPFRLEGIKILLLNSNVRHSLASSEYNKRRVECQTAVEWIREQGVDISSLRDANEAMLHQYVKPRDLQVYRRSCYVVQEISRLQQACEALQRDDLSSLGVKMFATHDGLRNLYEVSCRELDWLVDQVRHDQHVMGARMMGGGFGGCTINLVKENAIDELIARLQPAYEAAMGLPLTPYVASIDSGTSIEQAYV